MSKNMAVLNEQNKVINIVVCSDDETETATLIAYDSSNPAYIGGDYFEGYFYPPKPFASWSRGNAGQWTSPIPYPEDGLMYQWDEETTDWVAVVWESETPAVEK